MDFLQDYSVDYDFDNARRAYRVKIPGLYASVQGFASLLPILDISSAGVALAFEEENKSLQLGQLLKLSLFMRQKLVLGKIEARIVRFMDVGMALEFSGLSFRQEIRLDKLVLESQKKIIELKKKMNRKKDDSQET